MTRPSSFVRRAYFQEADENKDEKVSIEEWINLLHNTDRSKEDPWFHDYMGFMFKLFDVSGRKIYRKFP